MTGSEKRILEVKMDRSKKKSERTSIYKQETISMWKDKAGKCSLGLKTKGKIKGKDK